MTWWPKFIKLDYTTTTQYKSCQAILQVWIRNKRVQIFYKLGVNAAYNPGALDFEMEKNSRKLIVSGKLLEGVQTLKPMIFYHSLGKLFCNSRWRPAAILDLWNSWILTNVTRNTETCVIPLTPLILEQQIRFWCWNYDLGSSWCQIQDGQQNNKYNPGTHWSAIRMIPARFLNALLYSITFVWFSHIKLVQMMILYQSQRRIFRNSRWRPVAILDLWIS